MIWPNNKKFAFTIIDDTDNSTVGNIKPIYDLLYQLNIKTTKSVWVYSSRDHFRGDTILDSAYQKFILDLKRKGFEIALHNVGSGVFKRDEISNGLLKFKNILGQYPKIHINHSQNKDNLYWGSKRFSVILSFIHRLLNISSTRFEGDEEGSPHFWGDICRSNINYVRNRVFNGINTLVYDCYMPYKEAHKPYVNFWFSASDGHTVSEFLALTKKRNIDLLEKQGGLCIVYTHFASGFVKSDGALNHHFEEQMKYLATKNAWFVPASEILDYLQSNKKVDHYVTNWQSFKMDVIWLIHRIIKRIKYKR